MSATLDSMRKRYTEPEFRGTYRNNDRTPVAQGRPLREVAAEQAERLRTATGRPAANTAVRERVEAQVAALRADRRWAGPTRTAPRPVAVVERPSYKVADELATQVPAGLYALPRKEASSAGNTVTFFKVHPFRGGHRIVQLLGSIGAFTERPLPVQHQVFALTHILEDAKAAAVLFGRETATCGMCGSPLTNDASRKAGIGPKCARKF